MFIVGPDRSAISGEEQGDIAGPLQYQVEASLGDVSKEK